MQKNYEIFKDLIQTVGLLYYFYCLFRKYLKKKALKMKKKSSKNDQSTGHFQSFFSFFFCPLTLNLKKKSCKSTNKKILALVCQTVSIQI